MRTTLLVAFLAGVSVVVASAPARADDITGTYEVEYKEVSTNCTTTRLNYAPGNLALKRQGNQLVVDIPRTPEMLGPLPKSGKISAKSKSGNTMIEGMKGAFSVAGRVTPEGMLYLVMVGEYSANGRALCTQSWNVTGPRAGLPAAAPSPAPAKPTKPAKPAKA